MRPEPTEEQSELKRAVAEVLASEVTPERLLAWERDPTGADEGIWRHAAELGWLGLGLPAAVGGGGASLVDVACLVEEAGRGLLARPVIGAIRGALAVADVAPKSGRLAALARGVSRVALALDEPRARVAARYRARIEGDRVFGEKAYVPDAETSDLHLVAAREEGGLSLVLVDGRGPDVTARSLQSFGNDRQAHVRYEGAPVAERLVGPAGGERALAALWRRQVALALAEMVGGMTAVLERTVAYVKEREQFGQKIAVFQAVRHQVADMGTRATAARHLAWRAITRVARGMERGTELATAAAYVGQGFKRLCWTGHHLHGGAGFVVEHPLRFHSERAQSLCIRYASEGPALAQIAAALLDPAEEQGAEVA